MNTKAEQIYEILKRNYETYDVPDEDLRDFAEQLHCHVFKEKGSLMQIVALVDYFESVLEQDDIKIDISQAFYVFSDVMDILDENSENAERLYKTFLEFRDFNLFALLMKRYKKWLTDDKKKEVMKIAVGEFDKTLLERYL